MCVYFGTVVAQDGVQVGASSGRPTGPPRPAAGGWGGHQVGVENCCFVVVALDMESVTFY